MARKYRLTPKQEMFINEYIVDFNATQAAIKAGYTANSAGVTGCKLLKKANIREAIKLKTSKIVEKNDVKVAQIIKKLEAIIFSDITDFVDIHEGDFFIKNQNEMKDTSIINKISKTVSAKQVRTEVKLEDKMKAIELLGKYYQMFTDKIDVSGEIKQIKTVKVTIKNE